MDRNTAVTTWREVCGSDTVMASGIVTGRMLEDFASRIEAMVRAAERELWQPMKTAPKDGTAVLVLLADNDTPHAVRWLEEQDAANIGSTPGWHMTWDGYRIAEHDGPRYWMRCPDDPDDGEPEDA